MLAGLESLTCKVYGRFMLVCGIVACDEYVQKNNVS